MINVDSEHNVKKDSLRGAHFPTFHSPSFQLSVPHLLLIDDDRAVTASLRLLLGRNGFRVSVLHHPRDIEEVLLSRTSGFAKTAYDLVLLDMNFAITTTGKAGLDALDLIKELAPKLPVILITGWATVQLAVEGMKRGAADFIAKPWDNKQLLGSIRAQLALKQPTAALGGGGPKGFEQVIGASAVMRERIALAERVAPTDASVLLTGESGTGKEVFAEAIHMASPRADMPFVAVNLGGVPEALFESELFGHKAGAFTDARADRKGRIAEAEAGTLFLDEIGDTPASAQVKLLRVLQERTYAVLGESRPRAMDVRIICATHRDLPALVADGRFREDLFYRINLIEIKLPPLRDRGDDVTVLAKAFLQSAAEKYQRPVLRLSPKLPDYLRTLQLMGNVRQLRNLMERCALLYDDELTPERLSAQLTGGPRRASAADVDDMTLEELERTAVQRAMDRNGGQVAGAARDLGITRASLYRRLEKYGH